MTLRFVPILLILPFLFGCDGDNVTEPPEPTPIRITSPSNNSTLEDPVTVIATAGSGYTFTRVDFYIDGDSVWSDNLAPYQYYWNIFVYSGTSEHTILAVGHTPDTSYTSATITVDVVVIQGFSFLSAYVPNSLVAHGVTSYENVIMFVATGDPGVEVIDISSKSSPQYLSRYDSFGLAMKVDVSYPYVYIADRDEGALQVDFSDVGSLILTGIYNTPGLANDVAVSDNYLYVADQDGLAIADISIPDTLIALNRQELPTAVNYVVVRGDTAFATNIEGLYIIDFTNPYFPDILGGAPYITQGQAQAVAVTDTFAFIADGFEGVIALSINDPSNPRFLARYAVEQGVFTVDTGDSTLFIGAFSGGVFALDYSQPDTLRLIDQFESNNIVWQVHSNPPYLYAATSGGVSILRFVR
jgi:hypothetical protein